MISAIFVEAATIFNYYFSHPYCLGYHWTKLEHPTPLKSFTALCLVLKLYVYADGCSSNATFEKICAAWIGNVSLRRYRDVWITATNIIILSWNPMHYGSLEFRWTRNAHVKSDGKTSLRNLCSDCLAVRTLNLTVAVFIISICDIDIWARGIYFQCAKKMPGQLCSGLERHGIYHRHDTKQNIRRRENAIICRQLANTLILCSTSWLLRPRSLNASPRDLSSVKSAQFRGGDGILVLVTLNLLICRRKNDFDVARMSLVRVDATMRTICSTAGFLSQKKDLWVAKKDM